MRFADPRKCGLRSTFISWYVQVLWLCEQLIVRNADATGAICFQSTTSSGATVAFFGRASLEQFDQTKECLPILVHGNPLGAPNPHPPTTPNPNPKPRTPPPPPPPSPFLPPPPLPPPSPSLPPPLPPSRQVPPIHGSLHSQGGGARLRLPRGRGGGGVVFGPPRPGKFERASARERSHRRAARAARGWTAWFKLTSCSVVPWLPFFPFFFWGGGGVAAPLKYGLPKKGLPFFSSRVTSQLSPALVEAWPP